MLRFAICAEVKISAPPPTLNRLQQLRRAAFLSTERWRIAFHLIRPPLAASLGVAKPNIMPIPTSSSLFRNPMVASRFSKNERYAAIRRLNLLGRRQADAGRRSQGRVMSERRPLKFFPRKPRPQPIENIDSGRKIKEIQENPRPVYGQKQGVFCGSRAIPNHEPSCASGGLRLRPLRRDAVQPPDLLIAWRIESGTALTGLPVSRFDPASAPRNRPRVAPQRRSHRGAAA